MQILKTVLLITVIQVLTCIIEYMFSGLLLCSLHARIMSLLSATLPMFSERYKLNRHMNCRLIFLFEISLQLIIFWYTYHRDLTLPCVYYESDSTRVYGAFVYSDKSYNGLKTKAESSLKERTAIW